MKFDSLLLKDAVVEADCIIPPLREDDPVSSDSDPDEAEEDVAYAKGVQMNTTAISCKEVIEQVLEMQQKQIRRNSFFL